MVEGDGALVIILLVMSAIDISSLPISKIKSALKDLGLSGSGTKKELIERYNEYMKNPEKSVAGGDGEKGVEAVMDDGGVSNGVSSEKGTGKNGAEKVDPVGESVEGEGDVAVEGAVAEISATEASATTTTETTAVAEATGTSEPTVTAEATVTTATEATPAATETTPATTEATTPTTPTTDIEAELTRREERAKRFGGEFDRERCRQQLLKEQQRTADASLRESRRARFGASDAEKKQEREARFGAVSSDSPANANAEPANDAVKAARIAKFGQVDMSRFERKRSQPLSRGRKSRRFHCRVC